MGALSAELAGLDFTRLIRKDDNPALKSLEDRAQARLVPFTPITPEERLHAFERFDFHPNGLYLPDDEDERETLKLRLEAVGNISNVDERKRAYHALQEECALWELQGVVGRWTGQQALARSRARFRIAAFGRRAGKTTEASMEAVAVAYVRPRSWVWLAAPTMKLASRGFDKVLELVNDMNLETRSVRDSGQEKQIILANGSKLEAISLENIWSAAGAAIDFAVIDEAAQIVPEAWTRAILPPLTDRNGQALLISSWEGEGDFFQSKALEAEADKKLHGAQSSWELFQDASYDVNFYAFPQGEKTQALLDAQKEMEPHEYLEQFGAVPATSRDRVFPEFKERVHVGDGPAFDFNPALPVILVVDPSGGANPYAVLAIQEYGDDYIVIFDEFYESHRSTEEIAPMLAAKPWLKATRTAPTDEFDRWDVANCQDMIVDSASPEEIRRWIKMGFPAYGVPNKPQVPDRVPLMKNWLRDPVRFRHYYRRQVNRTLKDMGHEPDADESMTVEERRMLLVRVEESFSDQSMTQDMLRAMRECARVRVNRRCTNTIGEFKSYAYPKKRKLNMNYREVPRDWMNHAMDCYGYYLWARRRFTGDQEFSGYDYVSLSIPIPDEEGKLVPSMVLPPVESPARTPEDRARLFVAEMRRNNRWDPVAPRSYLRA